MKNFLNQLSEPDDLLKKHNTEKIIPEVNGHLHSPFSFCAFRSIDQMFSLAEKEDIVALGINDFFSVDGYPEFEKQALSRGIFPLFNIEFMGLIKEFQEEELRINDPNNPGRIYFSGKALKNPLEVKSENQTFLSELQANSQVPVKEMCQKANDLLSGSHAPFSITFEKVRDRYAENIVRERHIARAIREASYEHFPQLSERYDFFERLFGGDEIVASFNDSTGVENEIRSKILKKGGPAYVPEDGAAFPELKRILDFILDAGGIPCYPVLLDDPSGYVTDFESDWDLVDSMLKSYGVACIELIPHRNSLEKLVDFVEYFKQRNYVISFGTEHNTPDMMPIKVYADRNIELTPELKEVSYNGICVQAAHQYLVGRGNEGFIRSDGINDVQNLSFYQELGHAVIREFNALKS